jgi:DNA-binding response OmpR family regulator
LIGESSAVTKKHATILLLASDAIIRTVLHELLEAQGYVVLPASDLSGALDWLGRSKPDLLIVRPYLSGIPGPEAARYLRTKCNGLRILMVAGFPDDNRLQYRASIDAIDIFPKPFTAAEFIQKVSDVLGF